MQTLKKKTSFYTLQSLLLMFCIPFFISCSDSEDLNSINVGFNSSLIFEDNISNQLENKIILEVKNTLSLINEKMPIDYITFKIRSSSSKVIPEIGIGGSNPNQNEVIITINLDYNNLTESLNNELGPLLAHEIHHVKRRRSIGYGNTLVEALISEGLADSFSVELFNIPPPIWANALTQNELQDWLEQAQSIWTQSNYNHGNWFLGHSSEIPRWAGYSIGYKLTQDYLSENINKQPSSLYGEPFSSFLP